MSDMREVMQRIASEHPLPDESFLIGASHHFFENGNIRSLIPRFHPYQSETLILSPKRASGALRLAGGQSLGIGGLSSYGGSRISE